MNKKILMCATTDLHFKAFHQPCMKWFQEQGWEVHVAAKGDNDLKYCDKRYNIPIVRSPLRASNYKAFKMLKRIINAHEFSIIHCHTPMGGLLTRLAAIGAREKGTKIIYTAHGFHFYKGCPLINWIVYYPLEKWLAHYTDCLITINNEDYDLAKKHHFGAKKIEHVHGVGVDSYKYCPITEAEKDRIRMNKGYSSKQLILFYAAEFNKNKNQALLIKVISELKELFPQIKLLLAGSGHTEGSNKRLAHELNLKNHVDFLGYRNDIDELIKMSDAVVASSYREGLPVIVLEGMACGKPIIVTDNRGHRELIKNKINGWLVAGKQITEFTNHVKQLLSNKDLYKCMELNSRLHFINTYDLVSVMKEMTGIYKTYGCDVNEPNS